MPGLFADPALRAGFVVVVVFTPICMVVTGLRFYAARLMKRRLAMEDWFAFGALLCLLLWVVFLSIMASNIRAAPEGSESTPEQAPVVNQMLFVASLMFPLNQLCAKLSILFLYHRIFGVICKYAFWIKVVGILQAVHTLENIIVNVFQCVPVQKFWEPQIEGHCIHYGPFLAVNESANSIIDFILAIQAVIMLRSLQTDEKTRWRLSIVFAIGGLAGVIGFVKIGMGLASGVAVGNQYLMGVWASVQMALSIICCCVVTFKPLLAKIGNFTSNFTSKASLLLSWTQPQRGSRSSAAPDTKDSTWIKVDDRSDCVPLERYGSQGA